MGQSPKFSFFPAAKGEQVFSERQKSPFTSNPMIVKAQVLLRVRTLPFGGGLWEGCAGSEVLGEELGVGRRLEKPTPGHAGEAGSWGGQAWDLRAPPRGQLARGWGVTASTPCRRRRRCGCNREVRGGFLLSAQRGRRPESGRTRFLPQPTSHSWLLEPRLARPGVRQRRPPRDQVGSRQVGLRGQRRPAALEGGGLGGVSLNLGRAEGVEGQRGSTPKRTYGGKLR